MTMRIGPHKYRCVEFEGSLAASNSSFFLEMVASQKPTNDMVRRLIALLAGRDRGGSF